MPRLPFDISRLLRTPTFVEDSDPRLSIRGMGLPPPESITLPGGNTPMMGPRPEAADYSGTGVPVPSLDGGSPTPYSPMAKARYDYVTEGRGDDGKYHRSAGDIAKSALAGLGMGLASGQGLGGAIGGAIGGGVGAAINPRGARENLFDQTVAPRLMRDQAAAQQYQAQQHQQQEDLLNDQYRQAQTGALNRSNLPAPPRPPSYSSYPGGIFNTQTGEVVPGSAPPHEVKGPAPHWERDERGRFINLNAAENQGKVIRGYDRPRAARPTNPNAPVKRGSKGSKSMSDVLRYMEDYNSTAPADQQMTESDARAIWENKGWKITR